MPDGSERTAGRRTLAALSRWPATAAVAAGIFALSAIPRTALPEAGEVPHLDKLAHVIEYGVLGVFLFRSLLHEMREKPGTAAIMTVLLGTAFGATDEWHQTFTGRAADAADVAADIVGLVLACALLYWRRRKPHGS